MNRYDFYKQISEILMKENAEKFFNYIIHSMDDNGGFLRTRYCYWDKTLPNKEFNQNINTVLLTFSKPFDAKNINYYNGNLTDLKMQLFYEDLSDENSLNDMISWSDELGYSYPVIIDLKNNNYIIR